MRYFQVRYDSSCKLRGFSTHIYFLKEAICAFLFRCNPVSLEHKVCLYFRHFEFCFFVYVVLLLLYSLFFLTFCLFLLS